MEQGVADVPAPLRVEQADRNGVGRFWPCGGRLGHLRLDRADRDGLRTLQPARRAREARDGKDEAVGGTGETTHHFLSLGGRGP